MPSLIQIAQITAGVLWLIPLILFLPAVVRVWRKQADAIDVLVSPFVFIAADQVGFTIRWLIFPKAVSVMRPDEMLFWVGLYTASALSVVGVVGAYVAARKMR